MIICKNCGYKIIDDRLKFCPECGFQLHETTDDTKIEEITTKEYDTSKEKILIDYYERTVGTPVERPYYELVLYTYNDKNLILEEYINGGAKDEKCIQYIVPFEAYEKAMEVVKTFNLKNLVGHKGIGLDGKTYVIKFRESLNDENLYRFSDENVGEEETMMMFGSMFNVLSEYKHK